MRLLSKFTSKNIGLFVLTFVLSSVLVTLSLSNKGENEGDTKRSSRCIVLYRYQNGLDVYSDGDIYGREISVREYRSYEIKNLIYREKNDQKTIQDTTIQNGSLEEAEFATLTAKIEALNASSLPKKLPDVSPQRLQGPAEEVVLKARRTSSEEFKTIRAHMGASAEQYPADFLQLHRFLKQLIRQKISGHPD